MHFARIGDRGDCMPPRREVLGHGFRVLVLPDVHRLPTDLDELGVVAPIPRYVGSQLLRPPPPSVRLRRHHVLGTRMPVAAVNEHRYPQPREHEIGASREIASLKPEPDTPTVECAAQSSLGFRVLRPLARHKCTDLFRGRRRAIRPTDHEVH